MNRLIFVLIHHPAIEAERSEPLLEMRQLACPVEMLGLAHQMRSISAIGLADDWDSQLTDNIAAHDQDVGFIELGGVDEFPKDSLRPVKVRREEEARCARLRRRLSSEQVHNRLNRFTASLRLSGLQEFYTPAVAKGKFRRGQP